ncbi:hypothetical protein M0811_03244 [Anaeramoeba ignava]|uniref:Uncharacterized protein n=1 Tax=Anaeramoeba ignava TaxID=1746090 RepID=A0A9Q0L7M8_ANAIG|nr:hypothetical protein M0811_03244 [Anaeramoeba ignava]
MERKKEEKKRQEEEKKRQKQEMIYIFSFIDAEKAKYILTQKLKKKEKKVENFQVKTNAKRFRNIEIKQNDPNSNWNPKDQKKMQISKNPSKDPQPFRYIFHLFDFEEVNKHFWEGFFQFIGLTSEDKKFDKSAMALSFLNNFLFCFTNQIQQQIQNPQAQFLELNKGVDQIDSLFTQDEKRNHPFWTQFFQNSQFLNNLSDPNFPFILRIFLIYYHNFCKNRKSDRSFNFHKVDYCSTGEIFSDSFMIYFTT